MEIRSSRYRRILLSEREANCLSFESMSSTSPVHFQRFFFLKAFAVQVKTTLLLYRTACGELCRSILFGLAVFPAPKCFSRRTLPRGICGNKIDFGCISMSSVMNWIMHVLPFRDVVPPRLYTIQNARWMDGVTGGARLQRDGI